MDLNLRGMGAFYGKNDSYYVSDDFMKLLKVNLCFSTKYNPFDWRATTVSERNGVIL